MPPKKNKNKIAVFLIKEGFSEPTEILVNSDIGSEVIKNGEEEVGVLYYSESKKSEPNWLKKFFGIDNLEGVNFFNSNTRAVFLTEIENRVFALVFGYGKSLLKKDVFEDDFGLFTTLNLVVSNTLRSVDKVDLALSGKKTREQLIKSGEIKDFGIDKEQDLVNVVTGKCCVDDLGGVITGRDSFHVSVESDFKEVRGLLKQYLDYYKKDDYKKDFGWIDNIRKVEDKKIIERLDEKLVEEIKKDEPEKIWLAVPDIIDWSGIEGFKYNKTSDDTFDDLYLEDFKNYLGKKLGDLTVKKLKYSYDIHYIYDFAKSDYGNWNVYDCLYCEIKLGDDYYILNNKKWYKIDKDFVSDINRRFENVPKIDLSLPDYEESIFSGKGENKGEGGYNKMVSDGNVNFVLFDKKMIAIGGGHSQVEFCDLFSKDNKRLIHVKIYGGSNVLSHLFNQGLVSGESFLGDEKFREDVNKILPTDCKLSDITVKPVASEYEVVFAIISSSKNELGLPFFSKIALSNVYRRLETLGYKISIAKIEKIKE